MCRFRSSPDNILCRDFSPLIKRNRGMINSLFVSVLSSTGTSTHRPLTCPEVPYYSKLTLATSPLETSKRARRWELLCGLFYILLFCRKSQDNISCGCSNQTVLYTVNVSFSIDYKALSKAAFLFALVLKY
jgi:hypothetical protein